MQSSPNPVGADAVPSLDGFSYGRLRQDALALLFFSILFVAFFSPAILSDLMLAPGDGRIYYLPHYEMPYGAWNPLSMTGFPEFGDPQVMRWYLPKLLLSWIPNSWNFFVISAYVLASWFTYLYVRALKLPGFGALLAGTSFGLCGFMVAHLGHTSIIHAAAWIPGLIWAIEELAATLRVRWILLAAIALTQSILAGHPQIALYGLTLTGAYAVVRGISIPRRFVFFAMFTSVLILAAMASAVQTLSSAAVASMTTRAHLSFSQFSEYSLSIFDLALLVFPCLFGGAGATNLDGIPFFAAWSITEVAGFTGTAIGGLALIAALSRFRQRIVIFWLSTCVLSLLAAMGDGTPLGRVVYWLPGFGQFRAPARFLYLFCFAISVLAAYGIATIMERPRRWRDFAVVGGISLAVLVTALLIPPFFGKQIRDAAAAQGFHNLSLTLAGNRWLAIPVESALVVAALLLIFIRHPWSYGIRALLLAAAVFELGTFGWYAEWRFASPKRAELQPPKVEAEYAQRLRQFGGRWLTVQGGFGALEEAPPDLSALWGLPAVGKYGPLMPARYREMLRIESNGVVFGDWWNAADRSFDLVGARLFAVSATPQHLTEAFHNVPFPAEDINLSVGKGCGATTAEGRIDFARSKPAKAVGIVSLTGCTPGISQGTPIAELQFRDDDGHVSTSVLRAGVESAEWAAACADVIPEMRHRSAEVYSRFPAPRSNGVCQGQRYGTILPLSGLSSVRSMSYRWLPAADGIIRLLKVVFTDGVAGHAEPIGTMDEWIADGSRWKLFKESGGVQIYENQRAMPRAWLVPETISMDSAVILRTIRTSRLPDGRAYEPGAMALIEDSLGFHARPDAESHVWITEDRGDSLQLQTLNREPAFLVLGDLFFPGWAATVNGRPSPVLRTNYIQRGVLLPAGQNFVRFEFHPPSLYAGLAVTASGWVLMAFVAWSAKRRGVL